MCIPMGFLRTAPHLTRPLRMDVIRAVPSSDLNGERILRWRKCQPWPSRLALRTDNPGDLGWLVFLPPK